jgi:hypothetical protein
MSCCAQKGCTEFFTERVARRDAKRYRRKGLDGNARRIVDLLQTRGLAGRTVLEIGGGVGALQLELLKAGAGRVVSVEASPAYEDAAGQLMREAGLDGRIDRHVVDFAAMPQGIPAADFVVLHRVVCCYPDFQALVTPAAARTRETLAMTFPRGAWWTRFGVGVANVVERLRRHSFRAFVHPSESIVAAAERRGLCRAAEHRGVIWHVVALDRA